ncbi:MAG: amidohydrolase [Spirochaetota bacterium]
MKRIILLILGILIIAFYFLLMRDFKHQNEAIYYNGTVITMNDTHPVAQAVYIKDGIIVAVGSNEEIMKLKTPDTELIDLHNNVMMPGFIDPHTHVDISAYLYDMVDLSGFTHKTNKDVWNYLEKEVKKFPKGAWIVCKGLDPILVADLKTPHISYLDKIAPENPLVILSQFLHSYWANTKAFQAAGIDNNTPNPSKASYYGRDAQGNLNGFIAEQQAFSPIREAMLKAIPAKKMLQNFEEVMKNYAANGFTTVVSAGLTSDKKILLRLQEHLSSGKPHFLNQLLALTGLFPKRSPLPRHFIYMRYEMENLIPASKENGDDFFKIIGIKIWYDGSPYTGSMYLKKPYLNSDLCQKELHIKPGEKGYALISQSVLENIIAENNNKKWQIAIHAQGDQAIAEVIQAFAKVNSKIDITLYRNRIEHCLMLNKNELQIMKQLNLTPSFHINHIYYYGKALRDSILGPDRTQMILPVKSTANAGIYFTLHADQPMFESNPFYLMYTAITRKTKEGIIIGGNEAIDIHDALKSMTTMAAWQIGFEDKLGSIEKGKYADFVILDRNPLNGPPEKIREIRVIKTIVSGNPVVF